MAGLIKSTKLTGILFSGLIVYFTNLYFLKSWPAKKGSPEQDKWAILLKTGLVEVSPSERRKHFKTTEYPPKKTFANEFATKRTSKIIWKNKKQVKTKISQSGILLTTGLVEANPSERRKNFKTINYPPKKTFASEFSIKGTSKIIWKNKKQVKSMTISQSGISLRTRLVEASPSQKQKENFTTTEYRAPKKTFANEFATKRTSKIIWKNKKQMKTTISQSGIPLRTRLVEASPSQKQKKNFTTTEYRAPKKTFANEFATKGTSKIIWKNEKQVKTTISQSSIPLRTGLVEASPSKRRKNFTTTEYPLKKTFANEFAKKETSKIIWKNKKQVKTTISQSGILVNPALVEANPSERRRNFTTTKYPPKKTFANEFATKGTAKISWKNEKQVKTTISQSGISLRTGLVEASSSERENIKTTEYPPKKTSASVFATKGTSKIIWKNKQQVKTTIPQSGIPVNPGLVRTSPSKRRKNFTITEYPPKKTFVSGSTTKGTSKIIRKNEKQVKTTISQSGISLRTGLVEASPSEQAENFKTTEYPPKKTSASEFATKRTSKIIWKNDKQVKTTISQSGIPVNPGLVEANPSERSKNFKIPEYPRKKRIASESATKGTSKIIPKNEKQVKTAISQSGISLRTELVKASPSKRRKNFTTTEYPAPKKTFASEFTTKGTTKTIWKNKKEVKTTISQSSIPLRTALVQASPSKRRKNFTTTEYPAPKKTFISWKNKKQVKTTISPSGVSFRSGVVEASPSERRKNFTTTKYRSKQTSASEFTTKETSKIIWKNKEQVKTRVSPGGISLRTGLVEASPSERRKNFTTTEYPPKKTSASEFATKRISKIIWKNDKQVKTRMSQSGIPVNPGLVEASPSERRKNFTIPEYPRKKTIASESATKGTSKIIPTNDNQVKTTITQSGNHLKIASNLTFKAGLQKLETRSCAHRINVMDGGIVLFRNITIRSKLGHARVLETSLEQAAAEDEFFNLKKGFFTLYCVGNVNDAKERLHSAAGYHALSKWVRAFEAANPSISALLGMKESFNAGQYLAIQRFEYANVYWTVIDLLDIFITTQRLGIEPEKLNIVLIDAHPPSSLDPFWSVLFQRLIKLGTDDIFKKSNNVMFENLVWRYPRVKCPLLDRRQVTSNLIQPFRSFVLKRFGIPSGPRLRDCGQKKLNVLVTFRRDYQNHPRNLEGIIDRKIANEKDVVNEMENGFPNLNITAAQLDSLPLKRQLELVASADIFFGMHGAAHAFPIFMAPGGAVIEMFNFQSNNWHMKRISILSGLFHITWINRDVKAYNKTTRSTTIPAGIPSRLLRNAIENICAHKFNMKKDKP